MFQIKRNIFFSAYGSLIKTIKHRSRRHDNYYNYGNVNKYQRHYVSSKIKFPTVAPSFASTAFVHLHHTSATEQNELTIECGENNLNQKLIEADKLLLERKYEHVVLLLEKYQHMNNVQVLWRLSKAKYYTSLEYIREEERFKLIASARESIMKTLKVDPSLSEVHKWYAVIIFEHCMMQLKIKKNQTYDELETRTMLDNFKKHSFKAMELNPEDPFTLYLIGNYCYYLADFQSQNIWLYTKLSDTPTILYKQALMYFKKAELIQPNFDIHNLLMLGKTFLQMNYNICAEYYFKQVTQYPVVTLEDRRIKEEGERLLKSIENENRIIIIIDILDICLLLFVTFVFFKLLLD